MTELTRISDEEIRKLATSRSANNWQQIAQAQLEADQFKVGAIVKERMEKSYNPDYLKFHDGVRATNTMWEAKLEAIRKEEREKTAREIIDGVRISLDNTELNFRLVAVEKYLAVISETYLGVPR